MLWTCLISVRKKLWMIYKYLRESIIAEFCTVWCTNRSIHSGTIVTKGHWTQLFYLLGDCSFSYLRLNSGFESVRQFGHTHVWVVRDITGSVPCSQTVLWSHWYNFLFCPRPMSYSRYAQTYLPLCNRQEEAHCRLVLFLGCPLPCLRENLLVID